jgi:hypothetical protein
MVEVRGVKTTMPEQRYCDLCGRSETELFLEAPDGLSPLEIDGDGLWMCRDCRLRLLTVPIGEAKNVELPEELRPLIGRSAGAICSVLNLPYEPPYQSVIDAAHKIAYDQDLYMSAWSFVTQWIDGTTIWRDEDGGATALVTLDGSVRIEPR